LLFSKELLEVAAWLNSGLCCREEMSVLSCSSPPQQDGYKELRKEEKAIPDCGANQIKAQLVQQNAVLMLGEVEESRLE
jgi:hypothetical protein